MSDTTQQTDAVQDGQTDEAGSGDGADAAAQPQTGTTEAADTSGEDKDGEDAKPADGDDTGDGDSKAGDEGGDDISLDDEEEDLAELQGERDKDKAPKESAYDKSRRKDKRGDIWESAITDDQINPAKVLQLSKDPFAKKGLEAFAKKNGYDSGQELVDEISKSVTEDTTSTPEATGDPRIDEMWKDRESKKQSDFFEGQDTERAEYKTWKQEVVKEIGKKEWDKNKDSYAAKRNELIKSGQSLTAAGKAAFNEIHLEILKAPKDTKGTDPSLDMPDGGDGDSKAGDASKAGRMPSEKYFSMSDEKRVAYAKKHTELGVVQFA